MPRTFVARTAFSFLALVFAAGPAGAQSEAESLSSSFRKAAKRVLPTVVTIRPEVPPVEILGGERMVPPIPAPIAGGSGVVIDAEKGLVLTNDHVVAVSPRVVVFLPDGRPRPAKSVRRDPKTDLALVTIDPQGLKSADWGDSESLEIGDWVLAVGQPFGLSGTVTAGIVSGKGRGIGVALYEDLIQTDAAIQPGNSGGPLVNLKGEIVGINTAIKTLGGAYEGIGFAVPSARAKRVAADLAEFGRVRRSYLGLGIRPVDPATSERLGGKAGVFIFSVALQGPGTDAGLRPGDVIVGVSGKEIAGIGGLQAAIEVAPIGKPLELKIVRDGAESTVTVRPVAQPEEADGEPPAPRIVPTAPAPPAPAPPAENFPELGLRLGELTAEARKTFGYGPEVSGLVIRGIERDGPADRSGLESGMVITDAADRKVETIAEFREAIAKRDEGKDLLVRIRKGDKAGFRVIFVGKGDSR